MSTAGKVLVVLVMLAAMGWLILAGGVAQLNRNGNEALQKLTVTLEKVQADLQTAKHDILTIRDQTALTQESVHRDMSVLRSRQSDLEGARSQIVEGLSRVQYQLATVNESIKEARTSLEIRNKEHQDEEKEMVDLRTTVQALQTENAQLMARLQSLRQKFRSTFDTNREMLNARQ